MEGRREGQLSRERLYSVPLGVLKNSKTGKRGTGLFWKFSQHEGHVLPEFPTSGFRVCALPRPSARWTAVWHRGSQTRAPGGEELDQSRVQHHLEGHVLSWCFAWLLPGVPGVLGQQGSRSIRKLRLNHRFSCGGSILPQRSLLGASE